MAVVVDSGVLIGWLSQRDARHQECRSLFEGLSTGRDGVLLIPDAVLIETLNFLRAKVRVPDHAARLGDLYFGRHAWHTAWRGVTTAPSVLQRAHALHLRYYGRGLSMTDCVVIAHAENVNAKVATFDKGFEGLVPLVEP